MIGGDHVGVPGDQQTVGPEPEARGREIVEFTAKNLRIDDDAVADQVQGAGMQDAARHEVENHLLAVDDERVPGVVAP